MKKHSYLRTSRPSLRVRDPYHWTRDPRGPSSCVEEILAVAIKCKHCGEMLNT